MLLFILHRKSGKPVSDGGEGDVKLRESECQPTREMELVQRCDSTLF
jgi:hypothetical protein